jgi:hypothetical protein
MRDAPVARRRDPTPRGVAYHVKSRVWPRLQARWRFVRGAVIDDHDLNLDVLLAERIPQGAPQKIPPVTGRDHDAYSHNPRTT